MESAFLFSHFRERLGWLKQPDSAMANCCFQLIGKNDFRWIAEKIRENLEDYLSLAAQV